MHTLKASCLGFNRLPSPLEKSHNIKNYYALVGADDFFNLEGWRRINVRDPKSFGRIPNRIKESLREKELFCLINRGIILSAKDVRFDNKTDLVEIDLDDPSVHGLLDGGHTYLQVRNYKEGETEEREVEQQIIKVEIVTGLSADQVVDVADGRNTSNQVKEVSLDDLQDGFADIKEALKDQPYAGDLAYKEYETYDGDDKRAKPVSVVEILKCLVSLDRDTFNDEKHPTQIVSRDNETIAFYREHKTRLKPILGLLPEALVLSDTIKQKYVECYSKAGGHATKIGERDNKFFKKLKKPKPLYFSNGSAAYSFPDSLRLPVFAAFRALIQRTKQGKCTWRDGINPSDFFINDVGSKLTRVVCGSLMQTQDVTKTSRTESVWESCYDKVRIGLAESD